WGGCEIIGAMQDQVGGRPGCAARRVKQRDTARLGPAGLLLTRHSRLPQMVATNFCTCAISASGAWSATSCWESTGAIRILEWSLVIRSRIAGSLQRSDRSPRTSMVGALTAARSFQTSLRGRRGSEAPSPTGV